MFADKRGENAPLKEIKNENFCPRGTLHLYIARKEQCCIPIDKDGVIAPQYPSAVYL